MHARLLLPLVVLLSAPRVAAQEQPAMIPTALAVALLDRGESASGNRSPLFVVGHAPPGMPASLTTLEGGEILGGVEGERAATVVFVFTRPPNQALLAADKQFVARGWRPPPPPPGSDRGGFVSMSYGFGPTSGSWYCGDTGLATVGYAPAPMGGTYLSVRYQRDRSSTVCEPRRSFEDFRAEQLPFPRLIAPAWMTQMGGGGGGGGDNTETSTRLTGPIELQDIVVHYLKQLDSAGWKVGTLATSGVVTIAQVATTHRGKAWTGALVATRLGPSEIDVAIRMARPRER